ncbi:MAG: sialate O-acetylesterase [Pirellulaceae bacterium]
MKLSRRFQKLALSFVGAVCVSGSAWADVDVPNIFADHMVLQQKQQNKVWGKAAAGEKISVTIGDQSHSATAGDDGLWSVMLEPLPAGGPHELVIKGNNEIKITDVLVGEVWICSGQSNMQWRVNNANDPDLERLTAKHPTIRMINFPQVGTQEPVWDHPNAKWMVCTPENVGDFSAVGYFFGRTLSESLDVPIGLVNNAWGGSACEAWIARDVLEQAGNYSAMLERGDATARQLEELKAKDSPSEADKKQIANLQRTVSGNHRPANIYNGVLKSHIGYGIKGAIWYQGESNASRAYQYRDLFPLMIKSWRDEWGQGDFPFYWVQLADFREEKSEPAESDWAELASVADHDHDQIAQ